MAAGVVIGRFMVWIRRCSMFVPLLAIFGCGSATGNSSLLQRNGSSGFTVSVSAESFIDGGTITLADTVVEDAGPCVEVDITVRGAQGLKALYVELEYDPDRYSPIIAEPTTAMTGGPELLSVYSFRDRGIVHYGQVIAQFPNQPGFSGDGALARLVFSKGPAPETHVVSAAPTDDRSRTTLYRSGSELTWRHYCSGDYNQNGLVEVADLTPLGINYDAHGPFNPSSAISAVDGNLDGMITVSDITPIGVYFGCMVQAYNVYASPNGADYPPGGTTAGNGPNARLLATVAFSAALAPAGERKLFSHTISAGQTGDAYWVRPTDGAMDGLCSNLVGDGIELAQLPGPPEGLANDNLPQIDFPAIPEDAVLTLPSGLTLASDRLGVMFKDDATVGEANALLTEFGAVICGSCPTLNLLVLRFEPAADPAGLAQVLDIARASGAVEVAAADVGGMEPRALPPFWDGNPNLTLGAQFPLFPAEMDYQSWGLEDTRAPQAWNLRDYGLRQAQPADALIIDAFLNTTPFPDLDPRLHFLLPRTSDSGTHGNDVARQLGAAWGNQVVVDAINPLEPELYCYDLCNFSDMPETSAFWLRLLPVVFDEGLRQHPSIVAVNMSFGLAIGNASLANQPWMDPLGDLYYQASEVFATRERSNFLICSAAGYEGDNSGALLPYDSVANNAAVRHPQGHFLAVEAITGIDEYIESRMDINLGGTVSAPGWYSPHTGTSFATPQVNSLITYLWALKPTLSWDTVKTLVSGEDHAASTIGGTKRRIDSYNALMGIDALPVGFAVQQAMVDVDDGTPDGQQRVDPFSGQTVTAIATPDGRRGDGRVTMRDFRCWRDAFVQLQTSGALADQALDGPALHFKNDLNCDGVIGSDKANPPHPYPWTDPTDYLGVPPSENVYPRCDFNGDGLIDLEFQPVNKLERRDIDLLADPQVWQMIEADGYNEGVVADPGQEGVTSAAAQWNPLRYVLGNSDAGSNAPAELRLLPDYLHSCDVHLQLDFSGLDEDIDALALTVSAELWPDGIDNNGVDGIDEPFETSFDRSAAFRRGDPLPVVLTVPLWTGKLRVSWAALDDELPSPSLPDGQQDYPAKFGQDVAVTVPGGAWSITGLGVVNANAQPVIAEIGGKPAAAVLDVANKQLLYYAATDSSASAWNAPVKIADHEYFYSFLELAELQGRPCVAYVDEETDGKAYLRFVTASQADGSVWPASSVVTTPSDSPYLGLDFASVNGRPALAFVSQTWGAEGYRNNIEYVYAADTVASAWLTPVKVVDYHYSAGNVKLADMNGVPGLAWTEDVSSVKKMYYSQASAAAGTGWSTPTDLGDRFTPMGLLYTDSAPALVYYGGSIGGIHYVVADNAAGSSWGSAQQIATADAMAGSSAGVALVGGYPAVICSGMGGVGVRYLQATDDTGSSWPAAQVINDTAASRGFSLADIGGNPAFGANLDNAASVGIYH